MRSSSTAYQFFELVVRDPELLEGAGHGLELLELLDVVAAEGQGLQALEPAQAGDLLDAVRRQGEMPAF